jgi:C1A family cysteine protease
MEKYYSYLKGPWQRDSKDDRDFIFKQPFPINLPPVIDLRPFNDVIYNQYRLSSCVVNATLSMLTYIEKRKEDKAVSLSRLFAYYNARSEENKNADKGATNRNGIKTLAKYGVCEDADWKYDIFKFDVKPPPELYEKALSRRIKKYYSVTNLEDVLYNLASDRPVLFGFEVFDSFAATGMGSITKTGIYKHNPKDKVDGGHAVVAVGYDLRKKTLLVRNSWGIFWGDSGYCHMPFSFITSGYCTDFWVIEE